MKNQKGSAISEAIVLLIFVLGAGGWIANIVKMFYQASEPLTGMIVMRAIGVFVFPMGAVLGYF